MKSHVVVNFLIIRHDQVLLERKSHGDWKIPGGHVELFENPVDTVVREAREELGVAISFLMPPALFPEQPDATCLPTPFASYAHTVQTDGGLSEPHINVIYAYAITTAASPYPQEGQEISWISVKSEEWHNLHPIIQVIVDKGLSYSRSLS